MPGRAASPASGCSRQGLIVAVSPKPKRRRRSQSRERHAAAALASWRRRRDGLILLAIEVSEVDLTESLISSGWLRADQDSDREAVSGAFKRAIEQAIKPGGIGISRPSTDRNLTHQNASPGDRSSCVHERNDQDHSHHRRKPRRAA